MKTAERFTENWFSDGACRLLADLVRHTEGVEGRIVEIGSWEGKSTAALANAVFPSVVHAVDTWEGSPGEISEALAKERDVYGRFTENMAALTQGNVEAHRSDWRDYLAADRSPIRFCFIDATHTYEEVRDNLRAVLPLIVKGGVICGDDVHHEPVQRAVIEVLGRNIKQNGPLWWFQGSPMIVQKYREACETPSDIFEHLPTLVGLCESLNAKNVIELGTRGGVSTIAWLYGMELTDGHLWSVDIDPAPELTHERWTFLQGNDLDPQVVKQLPDAEIVFIDTSHEYQQTVAELNVYRWKVKPGGKIVLHDTELAHPYGVTAVPRFPVKTAVEEFCQENWLTWKNYPNCFGLGIVTIPEVV
jgi:predicted O-methyltransferase YrrM